MANKVVANFSHDVTTLARAHSAFSLAIIIRSSIHKLYSFRTAILNHLAVVVCILPVHRAQPAKWRLDQLHSALTRDMRLLALFAGAVTIAALSVDRNVSHLNEASLNLRDNIHAPRTNAGEKEPYLRINSSATMFTRCSLPTPL